MNFFAPQAQAQISPAMNNPYQAQAQISPAMNNPYIRGIVNNLQSAMPNNPTMMMGSRDPSSQLGAMQNALTQHPIMNVPPSGFHPSLLANPYFHNVMQSIGHPAFQNGRSF